MDYLSRDDKAGKRHRKTILCLLLSGALLVAIFLLALMVGSSSLTIGESFLALFGQGSPSAIRIIQQIRLPRAIAAVLAGGGLAISGLIMQTNLSNDMASPATLGVTNAAVLGANVAIIGFSGGFLTTGNNLNNYAAAVSPFATSFVAFAFALSSTLLVLGLSRLHSFRPATLILAGIGLGAIYSAATTLLQYFATDVGLSAAVIWSFGDLGRATYLTDWIMLGAVAIGFALFYALSWKFNAILSGEEVASSVGVKVRLIRFISLALASLITACIVSFLGIIGFVGIIAPHVAKRILGQNHRKSLPFSFLLGALLVLGSDTLIRAISGGTNFPIGAITSLLGAPFFLYLVFFGKGGKDA